MRINPFKKIILIIPLLSGCEINSYVATRFVRSNNGKSFSMSFSSFEGRYVETLNKIDNDHQINYVFKLEEGEANIYYKWGTLDKELLINIHGGDEIEKSSGYISGGYKTKIIIETVEKCINGKFSFSIN